ncbi:MAG: HEAT repeat domain-containing protein, partial [Candidatus Omnitrophota bacterium]
LKIFRNNGRSEFIQLGVIKALGDIGGDSAFGFIVFSTGNSKEKIREAAVLALEKMGDKRSVDALVGLLSSKNRWTRRNAAESLDRLKWQPADQDQQILYLIAAEKWEDLARVGETAIPFLEKMEEDGNDIVRGRGAITIRMIRGKITDLKVQEAIDVLETTGEVRLYDLEEATKKIGKTGEARFVPLLIRNLSRWDDLEVKQITVRAIMAIGKPAVPELLRALETENDEICEAIVETLGMLKERSAVPILLKFFEQGRRSFSHKVAEALGSIGDPSAVPVLIRALEHEEWRVRIKAIEALGLLKDERAIPHLRKIMTDEKKHQALREKAATALRELGWAPEDVQEGVSFHLGKQNWEELIKIGTPAAGPLAARLEKLYNEEEELKSIIAALGKIGDPIAVPAVAKKLRHFNGYVMEYAAKALGEIGNPAAIPALLETLDNINTNIRQAAFNALCKICEEHPDSLIELLNEAIKKRDNVKIEKLESILSKAAPDELREFKLEKAKTELLPKIKKWLPLILGSLGVAFFVFMVIYVFYSIRFSKYSGTMLKAMVDLKSDKPEVRKEAAKALGQTKDKRAIKPLVKALSDIDEKVRAEAAKALGNIGDKKAEEPLLERITKNKDKNSWVCKEIVVALEK